MKDKILLLLKAFLALLHTDADDKEQIALLKGQIVDLQLQLKNAVTFTDDDVALITAVANQAAAAIPGDKSDVATVAAITAASGESADEIHDTAAGIVPDAVVTVATAPTIIGPLPGPVPGPGSVEVPLGTPVSEPEPPLSERPVAQQPPNPPPTQEEV